MMEDVKEKIYLILSTSSNAKLVAHAGQLHPKQRRNEKPSIRSWEELKRVTRKRFIPGYYHRDLHHKLQTLTQGSMTVEDYFKEIDMAIMRANVHEDLEAIWLGFCMD